MSTVAIAAAWLTSLGVPVAPPPVVIEPMLPGIWAYEENGEIHADAETVEGWESGESYQVLIHALVHTAAFQAGRFPTPEPNLPLEEGIAQAVEDDLWWPFFVRFSPVDVAVVAPSSYPVQAAHVRRLSALGCRCPPDSRGARRWRWRFVTGDRDAMIREATSTPNLAATYTVTIDVSPVPPLRTKFVRQKRVKPLPVKRRL